MYRVPGRDQVRIPIRPIARTASFYMFVHIHAVSGASASEEPDLNETARRNTCDFDEACDMRDSDDESRPEALSLVVYWGLNVK